MNSIKDTRQKSLATKTFLLTLVTAAICYLPFVLMDGGFFTYYGDFNLQQIPFYKLAHDAVQSGDIFWNWNTDLGANFMGSYSFYLLFSPFFWLTLIFPSAAVPYLIAPLLILKTACAAFTAYFFIERFVKDKFWAMVGGILYAFSGFMTVNIFFNHFHDVVVFFPLLLYGVEVLVTENRRGPFALAVMVNAMVNYWFFIGEVVFTVLYVIIRVLSPGWRITVKRFLWVIFEACIGLACALFVVLPAVMAIMGNPRTGTENLLNGWNFWIYWNDQKLWSIISSMFFPPDMTSYMNMFPDCGSQWASMSLYLPLFAVSGAIGYVMSVKRSFLKRLLCTSLFIALVPGLNSAFIMFNNSYYARWFYMPVLLISLATAISLDNTEINFERGIKWSGFAVAFFTIMVGCTPSYKDGKWTFGLYEYMDRFLFTVAVAIGGFLISWMLVRFYRDNPNFKRAVLASVLGMSLVITVATLGMGRSHTADRDRIINTGIKGKDLLVMPETPDQFARSDFYETLVNMGMYWQIPNIQTFHSIVPASIMEFYPKVGVKRDVSSKPETKYYALRSLLSVRWLFIEENWEDQSPMPGYELHSQQLGFNIYENMNYIPMGFTYDFYFTPEDLENVSTDLRSRLMLKGMMLEQEAIQRNADILAPLPQVAYESLSEEDFERDAQGRAQSSCHYFNKDNTGFTARIHAERETMLFFSVPYEAGWSATVNGQPAVVEKANVGFMAVRIPEGDVEVRFNYMTPGLVFGGIVSIGALIILAAYILFFYSKRKKEQMRMNNRFSLEHDPLLAGYGQLGELGELDELHQEELKERVLKSQQLNAPQDIQSPATDDPIFMQEDESDQPAEKPQEDEDKGENE